ncbi:putative RNA-directed DNA polymerase from transposon X-element [Trichonephila clavipes]|nr:putative RNA-directed DNA polymerase from transposon X-element [Trichonephila clavipes]
MSSLQQEVAAVAEWYRHRIVAGFVTSSSPVPLKTRRVGQRCTLNLSRAETSSRWCGKLFCDYEPIFTDGSKSESLVGSAVVSLSTVITDALPISASIYTAKLHALRIALEHISLSCGKKFIIYTDSLSALQSIVSLHSSSHPILGDITYALANHLKKKDIRFCWIPGHAGITGNELADTAARSATGSSERFPIPHSDLKACFRQKLQSVWQSNWDQQTENKLHSVMPVLAPTVPSSSNRREQVIGTRLRLGYTRLRIGIFCLVNHHPIARNVMSRYR